MPSVQLGPSAPTHLQAAPSVARQSQSQSRAAMPPAWYRCKAQVVTARRMGLAVAKIAVAILPVQQMEAEGRGLGSWGPQAPGRQRAEAAGRPEKRQAGLGSMEWAGVAALGERGWDLARQALWAAAVEVATAKPCCMIVLTTSWVYGQGLQVTSHVDCL